jgi:5-methylcytosine-specific restriction endonuclease McrA
VSNAPRNTATRDRDRKAIARTKPPCGICGGEIDYSLPHTDPMAYVVDHIVPLAKGGLDELTNKQPAHRVCNRMKSDKLAEDLGPRLYVTDRIW